MKYLIMCEGPNELEIIRMLLEHDKLIFTEDDLLNLVPYHARQIRNNASVKNALNLYYGDVEVLRIGDKLNEELKIPKEYKGKIKNIRKYCTKPVSTMAVLTGTTVSTLGEALGAIFSPLAAFSFLTFTLLYSPCVAAIAAVKREMRSGWGAACVALFQCAVAWVCACLVYQIGSLFLR